jgi:hypothetical protein
LRRRTAILSLTLVLVVALSTLSPAISIFQTLEETPPLRNVSLQVEKNKIYLPSGIIDITKVPKLTRAPPHLEGEPYAYYIAHFTQAPTRAMASGDFVAPLFFNAYVMRMTPEQLQKTVASEYVDWVGEYKPEYKIDPHVYEQSADSKGSFGESGTPETQEVAEEDEYIVHTFEGENISHLENEIRAGGANSVWHNNGRTIVKTPMSNLDKIAEVVGVRWIERAYRKVVRNNNGTWIVQTFIPNDRKIFDNGITGDGQIVAVADTGIDADHLMFWDPDNGLPSHTTNPAERKLLTYYNWYQTGHLVNPSYQNAYYDPGDGYYPGPSDPMYDIYDWDFGRGHGSHVAGTVAGEWPTGVVLPSWDVTTTPGYDYYEGNAFGAKIVFQDLSRPDSIYIYPPPDLNDYNPPSGIYPGSVGLFPQAMSDGAYIHSDSWGGGAYQSYDSYSQDVDEMMWNNPDFLIVFANGNDGPGVGTITPPATAKDCLSVGAAETSNDGYGHNSENVASFSSWGPTDYWTRVKPDVVAPGYYISSARNNDITDGSSPNDGLIAYAGTSMATPAVAASAALIREYFMMGHYDPVGASTGFMSPGPFTPSAALMKAMVIDSAQPMTGKNTGGTIPAPGQGWGRVLLDNALYFAGDKRSLLVDDFRTGLDSEGIAAPSLKEYTITVAPGQPLDLTLAYTDPPATAGSAAQMINILFLEVDHPNGVDYYLSGDKNFANGESIKSPPDVIFPDVVQKVRINNPDPGVYTIRVRAFSTDQVQPGWNVQPYALAVSGNLAQSTGDVEFDQTFYTVNGPLTVTLTDADLVGAGTAQVTLTSAATGDSELATLTEVNPPSGTFKVAFPCDPTAGASPDDGILKVSYSDTLTVTYYDANPPGTRTDTARIDQVPPVITHLAASACNGQSVEITWLTDEDSDSVVHWGTTPSYGNTRSNSTLTTEHSVQFDGLQMSTAYYYEACSTDENGNTACSGPETFTTPMIYTPAKNHAGYISGYTRSLVLNDDDMWTGHDTGYGTQQGVFQFDLTGLPSNAYINSVQIVIFKQEDRLDPAQADSWSCKLIDFNGDLYQSGSYDKIHAAPILVTLSPTWTTVQLHADTPGAAYMLSLADPNDIAHFNPGGFRADRLTFRLDGATTGKSTLSWDTGYRQDLGSLGVCYKPKLAIANSYVGIVKPDQTEYPPTGMITVTLSDQDLVGAGTVTVTATSAGTRDVETVTLSEVDTSGIFRGSFQSDSKTEAVPNDGTLSVTVPDRLTVTYYDADPLGVRTASIRIESPISAAPVGGVVSNVDRLTLVLPYLLAVLAFQGALSAICMMRTRRKVKKERDSPVG